jgi:hypothetical protein
MRNNERPILVIAPSSQWPNGAVTWRTTPPASTSFETNRWSATVPVVRRAGAEHGLDAVYCGGDESDAHHAALFFAQALITGDDP